MNIIERHKMILEQLETTDCLTVEQIAELTGASLPTVRRDLKTLTEKQGLQRFRGGICLPDMVSAESEKLRQHIAPTCEEDPGYRTVSQMEIHRDEKVRIAQKAAEFVHNGDTIYIDGSTTTYCMCDFLRGKDIMVVTNGVDIIMKLMEYQIQTYVLDGQVNPKAHCILGMETVDKLEKTNFDKCFIGTRGIDEECGFTTTDTFDSILKSTAIAKAKESYVLADSTKFFQRKLYTYAQIEEAVIVTDDSRGFQSERARIVLSE